MKKDSISDSIMKYALQNAIKFNGKANPGAVIGKLIQEDASIKDKLKEIQPELQKVIKEISKLSAEEQTKKLKKLAPELLEEKKKEKKTGIKEIKNAEHGKVVTRFAPSPSGPMHLGHSYVLTLNSEIARKYGGKLILRIEDTNPENIYPDAYNMLPEEGNWLTNNNISQVVVQSERLGIYYDYAEKLVNMDKAYVCTCQQDKMREMKAAAQACPCRELGVEEQQKRYAKMFGEYAEGEAVLKLKTDIKDKNPALRDFPLMRINEHVHPKTKKEQRVWPLMNFSVAIDDALLGVTHCVRAKEHMDNGKKQRIIHSYLGVPTPTDIYVGRINFTDLRISCSKTRVLIEQKEYSGWDDIRLPFMAALKRRGYQPEAFIKYALDVGITENDKHVSQDEFFKALNAFNKEVIDPMANRYFIVRNPEKIKIEKAPEQEIELKMHPGDQKRGVRKLKVKDEFYIDENDLKEFKDGGLYRLMDCLNFKMQKGRLVYHSEDYETYKEKGSKIMHWLPANDATDVEVFMPDGSMHKCLGEKSLRTLQQGDIIQAERFGFMRLDEKKKDKLVFWFTHC